MHSGNLGSNQSASVHYGNTGGCHVAAVHSCNPGGHLFRQQVHCGTPGGDLGKECNSQCGTGRAFSILGTGCVQVLCYIHGI